MNDCSILKVLCSWCSRGKIVGFGLCEFFSICLEAALRELKSPLAFLILQLQTLLEHQQFFTLMRRLNLVNNCTFYNMNPLEPTSKAEALKRQCNFVKSYVIKTTFQQAEETEGFPSAWNPKNSGNKRIRLTNGWIILTWIFNC